MVIIGLPNSGFLILERVFSNTFGRNISYVNAIDSLITNQMPDFRIDDFIHISKTARADVANGLVGSVMGMDVILSNNITSTIITTGASGSYGGIIDYRSSAPLETAFKQGNNSGTSFAAPQVAGLAAMYLQLYPTLTPAQLKAKIINVRNKIKY